MFAPEVAGFEIVAQEHAQPNRHAELQGMLFTSSDINKHLNLTRYALSPVACMPSGVTNHTCFQLVPVIPLPHGTVRQQPQAMCTPESMKALSNITIR